MIRAFDFCFGAAVGAGLMYIMDPAMGRRRRSLAQDQAVSLAHQAQNAAGVASRDLSNRAQGLASGDFSVVTGRPGSEFGLGNFSPGARGLMTAAGLGLFVYGLTRSAPMACVMGTAGLALTAEGLTNASLEDIQQIPQNVSESFSSVADQLVGA